MMALSKCKVPDPGVVILFTVLAVVRKQALWLRDNVREELRRLARP
jgi:hypothetical protein